MKRILIVIFLFIIVSVSKAQNGLYIRSGGCGAWLGGDYNNANPLFGGTHGVSYCHRFGDSRFVLNPSLFFTNKGGIVEVDKYGYSIEFHRNYLEISPQLLLMLRPERELKVAVTVSPFFGYGVSGKYEFKEFNLSGDVFKSGDMLRYDLGERMGGGIIYRRFLLMAELIQGHLNTGDYSDAFCHARTRAVVVTVGVRVF